MRAAHHGACGNGPAAGVAVLDGVRAAFGDHRLFALRAGLTGELGRYSEARQLMHHAIRAARNDVERRHLQRRLDAWTHSGT
ncbi:hypothetical protein ACIBCB_26945 [Streptomyces uncialis]|uniref:hypothetical protein n=1 Tax=Streptomyces uncialis TaxID=1048205 RepID=UPI00379542AF